MSQSLSAGDGEKGDAPEPDAAAVGCPGGDRWRKERALGSRGGLDGAVEELRSWRGI
ncbi:hypothetical protein [Chondromyces crocatus]|uniref:hypothetical protein n=1 Tax=Chondromyces crocatus TaxID=52 RepID=UPI0012E1AD0C|nr:hypothetical protein [Chondromyces crocatus]